MQTMAQEVRQNSTHFCIKQQPREEQFHLSFHSGLTTVAALGVQRTTCLLYRDRHMGGCRAEELKMNPSVNCHLLQAGSTVWLCLKNFFSVKQEETIC